jgi:hypothetical protein
MFFLSGEVLEGGKTLELHNFSVDRMPLYHRGGGAVVTGSADGSSWSDLALHVWPTRAAFLPQKEGDQSQPFLPQKEGDQSQPLTRLLYAPSDDDPDASAPPLTRIEKVEHPGGKKFTFSRRFIFKTIVLPRQARDERACVGNTQRSTLFVQVALS